MDHVRCLVGLLAVLLVSCADTGGGGRVCGDLRRGGAELCDRTDLDGASCTSLGFGPGTLACATDCASFDTSGCTASPTCGNGMRNGPETCDGTDLGGSTCAGLGLGTGALGCRLDCLGYDLTGCSGPSTCGNGTVEGAEVCDGVDLDGATCGTVGAGTGSLGCASSCLDVDTSGCVCAPSCAGLECGVDPTCGLPCGGCDPGTPCVDGRCVEVCGLGRIVASRVLDVDLHVVRVTGRITLNGATLPNDTDLDTTARGTVRLRNVETGDEYGIDLRETGDVTYTLDVFAGTYDVFVRSNYASQQTVLPNGRDALVRRGLELRADGTHDVDLRTVAISGEVKLDGATMPNDTIVDAYGRGRLELRNRDTTDVLGFELGATGAATYGATIFAGQYDVFVFGDFATRQSVLPSYRTGLVQRAVTLDASGTRDFDARTLTLSGVVTLNGATMPNDNFMDGSPRGSLRVRNLDALEEFEFTLGESGPATYSTRLFAGRYDVSIQGNYTANQSVLPPRHTMRLVHDETFSASGTRNFDAKTVWISGQVRQNGAQLPNDTVLDGSARGTLRMHNVETNDDYDLTLGETGAVSFSQRIFVGLYDVLVYGNFAGVQSVLPPNRWGVVEADVPFTDDGTHDVDVVVVDVSGFVTRNGAALPNDFIVDGEPRGYLQFFNTDTEEVTERSLQESGAATYAARLFAGTYDVRIRSPYNTQQSVFPGFRIGLLEESRSIRANESRTYDVTVANVMGEVTRNGVPLPNDAIADGRSRGALRFRNRDTLETTEVDLRETGTLYITSLFGGAYDVLAFGDYAAYQSVLPPGRTGLVFVGCRSVTP